MIDLSGGISNPLIEAGIVVGVGAVALIFRRWRTCGVLCTMALAWALLCATPAFSLLLWHGLAHQYPPQPPTAYPRADAIVLVGGGPVPRPLQQWHASAKPELSTPLGFAVALYKAGKAPILVAIANYATPMSSAAIVRQGIPRSALRLEPASLTTHQDSVYAQRALQPAGNQTVLLVATDLHMPRTAATFRHAGFRFVAAPALRPAWLAHWQRGWHPSKRAVYLSESCLHEYAGMAYYRLRNWGTW